MKLFSNLLNELHLIVLTACLTETENGLTFSKEIQFDSITISSQFVFIFNLRYTPCRTLPVLFNLDDKTLEFYSLGMKFTDSFVHQNELR